MLLVELETGFRTGPHVCYRFWKNGKQVDALKLNFPGGENE
jgi:murein DD-endopeptidase MepM/ murein hydrolase activator NlpD